MDESLRLRRWSIEGDDEEEVLFERPFEKRSDVEEVSMVVVFKPPFAVLSFERRKSPVLRISKVDFDPYVLTSLGVCYSTLSEVSDSWFFLWGPNLAQNKQSQVDLHNNTTIQ
ncbi:unnamed protein product [Vicia faba]|uniref:Uncharacterized protein n=1 Tax=Vicia faba TaxID=3906 RepID=A0AAV1B9E2_VICFA|nr:unnamed protein product [Vicia faba]